MLAVVIRDLPYLKILQSVVEQLKEPYILYHYDTYRAEKEYLRASKININKAAKSITEKAHKIVAFSNDNQLKTWLFRDDITELISVEIFLWAKKYIRELKAGGIKLHNYLYLTDSLWLSDSACITSFDKIYYPARYIKETLLEFLNLKEDIVRDHIYNTFTSIPNTGNKVLVLLPNLQQDHINKAFGSKERFLQIIKQLAQHHTLVFKARQKQWVPPELTQYGQVVMDGVIQYPPAINDLFAKTHTTVMFYSSGVYEAVSAGQYVVNIPIPLDRWSWDIGKMKKYNVYSALYNSPGVVENVSQEEIINGKWQLDIGKYNTVAREKWIKEFISS